MSLRIYGHRPIQTLPGLETRPTPSRVRQAVFNMLYERVAGSRWLDLCAGSGAMGAEALCRQCREVVAVEQSAAACRVIRGNWQPLLQPEQTMQVYQGDVRLILKRLVAIGKPFDLIYFDPPYASSLYDEVLPGIPDLLTPEGILIVEHDRHRLLPTTQGSLSADPPRRYGQTALTLFRWSSGPHEEICT
ncbi:MAG: 16S rRNA (guanine(966)-N(2))-methyltransferase RsmD [Synechococcales cyanobacterium]